MPSAGITATLATGISFRCILEMALAHARSSNRVQLIQ